jgi:8-oxo-dGTP diphosphatase
MNAKMKTTEDRFLKDYDPNIYTRPNTSVDTVIFTVVDADLHVLLLKRAEHPFLHEWSLVGGYVDTVNDQDLESTAKRKLEEKTGVKTPYLEQFETIGNATRDPRGWSVTTVYFALLRAEPIRLSPGKGALEIKWAKVKNGKVSEKLAFDHAVILKRCVERLKNKVLYTSLPVYLMPKTFTLGELQNVYENILGSSIDHKSFRRRILSGDILEETDEEQNTGKRPAKLYRLKNGHVPHYFLRNLEGPHSR